MRLRTGLLGGLGLVILGAGACSGGENPSGDGSAEVTSLEQAVVQQTAVSVSLPAAVDFRNVAVGASKTLLLGDRSQLLKPTSGFADSTSASPTVKAHYGFNTQVGSIISAGPVEVMNNAAVNGSITAGKAITFGVNASPTPLPASVTVSGAITANASVPLQTLAWQVPFDLNTTNNKLVSSGAVTLAPGSYGSINIQGGTVTLQPGTYYVDSLTLEPNGKIAVNNALGAVYLYVRSSFILHGTWTATNPANVLLGYLGTNLLALEKPFAGTVVAPKARVRLAVGGTPHTGSVFALETELDPDVKLTFQPFSRWDAVLPDPNQDSDCDGAADALEVAAGLDPNNPADGRLDTDGDGIPANEELRIGGNPKSADTDGDGIGDGTDLVAGTDLDGDGKVYSSDNCPNDVNPGQQDRDGDGKGDVCDPTPSGSDTTALVALSLYRSPMGDAAVAPPGNFDTRRIRTDLKGLYATDVSVLAWQTAHGNAREITEWWHPTAGAHAYAISTTEKSTLKAAGYQQLGVLGYLQTSAPPEGVPVQVRRFSKNVSGKPAHAIATSASGAAALLTEGFTELAALGWGLTNEGTVVHSTLVTRYKDTANHFRYRLSALGEKNVTGWSTLGRQFRVSRQPSNWHVPLYRLETTAGVEALALSSEVAGFQAQGFVLRGVLGYVFPASGNIQSLEPTTILNRVSGTGKETVYTTSSSDLTSLLASGYSAVTPLARVVALRGKDKYRSGQACVGAPSIDTQVRRRFSGDTDLVRAGKTLVALGSACTMKRVTGTGTLTAGEQAAKTRLASMDPAQVESARLETNRILTLTAAERAALLGPLKSLDPGTCANPVDWRRLGSAVRQTLSDDANGTNGGVTGGATKLSAVQLRAPQCQGVAYAAGDRAAPGEGNRAVTASEIGAKPSCKVGEICPPTPTVGSVSPVVYGVLTGGKGLPKGGTADLWGQEHPDLGVPIAGIQQASDCSTCSTALGQACVAGVCRAYPFVNNHQTLRLSGANLWDIKTAQLRLTGITNKQRFDINLNGYNVKLPLLASELPARCDFAPADQSGTLGLVGGAPPSPCTPSDPLCLDPFSRGKRPNEHFVEEIQFFVDLPDTLAPDFYTVQVVNYNGSYIARGDVSPYDPADLAGMGHSIHVCTEPDCKPGPSPTAAACTQGLATCGTAGGIGGIWNKPPRSLSECQALAKANPGFTCPETPLEFVSPVTAEDGTPLQIFVGTQQPQYIQTRLSKVYCSNETGGDALGSDELVVSYGGAVLASDAVGDLEASADVYTTDIDVGDSFFPEKKFTSVRNDLDAEPGTFLLQVGEDDDIAFGTVVFAVIATVATVGTGGAAGLLVGSAWLAGGAAGLTTFLAGMAVFDPDDLIGKDGWYASSTGIALAGIDAHSTPLNPIPPFVTNGTSYGTVYREMGKHPAVDGYVYSDNNVNACTTAAQCSPDKPVCTLGACVPTGWIDRTLPVPAFTPTTDIAGTMQHLRMNNEGDYQFWLSTSVTGAP